VTFREAAELGIDNIEHGFFNSTDFLPNKPRDVCPGFFNPGGQSVATLDTASSEFKSLLRLLVDRKVALTSTLPVFETATPERPMPPGVDVLTPQLRDTVEAVFALRQRYPSAVFAQLYPRAAAMEVAFARAGGLLVAGSDAGSGQGGVIPGYANQREIELLVEAGLTPLEALKVATLNGATYLNRADEVGSIVVGKQADLVLVVGDPSVRIADLRNVELVFKAGKAFDPTKLIESVKGWVGIY
jgi:enamidase